MTLVCYRIKYRFLRGWRRVPSFVCTETISLYFSPTYPNFGVYQGLCRRVAAPSHQAADFDLRIATWDKILALLAALAKPQRPTGTLMRLVASQTMLTMQQWTMEDFAQSGQTVVVSPRCVGPSPRA